MSVFILLYIELLPLGIYGVSVLLDIVSNNNKAILSKTHKMVYILVLANIVIVVAYFRNISLEPSSLNLSHIKITLSYLLMFLLNLFLMYKICKSKFLY